MRSSDPTPYLVLRTRPAMPRGIDIAAGAPAGPLVLAPPDTPAAADVSVELHRLDPRALPELLSEPGVQDAAPQMPLRLIEPMAQRAPVAAELGGLPWGLRAVGADRSQFNGERAVVAVLDTGIDANHPAFDGVELVTANFTDEAPEDLHGHGTHCAGTLFGRDLGAQRIGVARGVRKAVIGKVLGQGASSASIARALQWAAEQGAHVVSMSLGTDFPRHARQLRESGFPEELAVSRALEAYRANVRLFETLAALLRAQARPVLIVAAAGNESRRRLDPRFEIGVAPPATAEGIVSVAALGQVEGGLDVADFSNTGAVLAGPGVDILSAARGGGLRSMSGTSMATPHVAGVAALWADQLLRSGPLSLTTLTGRLVGSTTLDGLVPGIDTLDVGAGLVQAPGH